MSQHYPALLVVTPLIAACLIAMAGWLNKRWCFPLTLAALGVALVSAAGMLYRVLETGPFIYRLGGWEPPVGIAYAVDHLNAVVLVVVAASAVINLIASRRSIEAEMGDRLGAVYALYTLSTAGLLGIVVTGDAFNLYVLLEIASLTGYALIALSGGRAYLASLNYVYMGTIGASFYLLGVGFLYIMTGTLNMADLAARLPALYASRAVLSAFAIIMVGLMLKMAFFPLHGWLPNAYSLAPSAVSGLLAPLATKVMVYVMLRMMITVFTPAYVFGWEIMSQAVVSLASLAVIAGAVMALAQREFKRMLAYIIVAEVGYMVGGAWLGNEAAMTGAILHLVNDALMTLCVFLAAGAMAQRLGKLEFHRLQGLFRKMPWTMAGLCVGALSIIGVPPTCGFFSKWYLISGALTAGRYDFVAALLISSLISVVLFFRVFEIAYYEPTLEHHGHGEGGHGPAPAAIMAEAPLSSLLPLLLVAAGLIAVGLMTGPIVGRIIVPALPAGLAAGG